MPDTTGRTADLAQRWRELALRVAAAAEVAGRLPDELTVIAVTKTFPSSDVAALHSLGVVEVGENRAQELAVKLTELESLGEPALHWHFIGQLQRNKAAFVGRHATALHTLDRVNLVAPLARGTREAGRRLEVFLQLSLDGDPKRGGLAAEAIAAVADEVAVVPELRLRGLMAVPPLGAAARPAFARLRLASEELQRSHPEATAISAGMSGDLEDAVKEGATHLRVGTALLGSRP